MVDGRAITEASGRITRETAPAVAATGVDLISCGWITHSVRSSTSGSTSPTEASTDQMGEPG
jgi:nicotinate-nucleotide pyrophosphorylase